MEIEVTLNKQPNDLDPISIAAQREGRIIMLYHSIAMAAVAINVTFITDLHNPETWVDYDDKIMVTSVINAQYTWHHNEASTDGMVKIVANNLVGDDPGNEFCGYGHEKEIVAGDQLRVGCIPSDATYYLWCLGRGASNGL